MCNSVDDRGKTTTRQSSDDDLDEGKGRPMRDDIKEDKVEKQEGDE